MVSLPADPIGSAGGLILVRQAASADRDALTSMFERCAPETRYRRFHGPVKAIPARYLAEALSASPFHYALVACPALDGADTDTDPHTAADVVAGEIVALASCRLTDEGAAELGVLIEDAWQHQGLGTRLVGDLVAHARSIGLRALEAQLLAEQAWIAGLLRPHGTCRVRPAGAGVLRVSLRLDEGQPVSQPAALATGRLLCASDRRYPNRMTMFDGYQPAQRVRQGV